jgi:hypothetical protein
MTERPSLKHKLKKQLVYWAYAFAVGHGAAGLAISLSYRPPFPDTVPRGPSEPHTRAPIMVFHGRDALPEARS